MQLQSDKSPRLEEIKTQFKAREGYYRLMNSPDYSQRSQRAQLGFSTGTTSSNSSTASSEKTSIKISLVTINDISDLSMESFRRQQQQATNSGSNLNNSFSNNTNLSSSTTATGNKIHRRSKGLRDKKICFNVGRELFVYNYDGVRTGPDASNPIYKRSYKGSSPTCHDFNQTTATSSSLSLLVGFSHGQVQLIDLNGCDDQESCKEFNVDRLIDKTRVTCVKWLPNSPSLFLVAHASGYLYLYKDDLSCGPAAPTYQLYKQSEGVTVFTCKSKTTRNPIYKWILGAQAAKDNIANLLGSSNSLHNIENESCSLNEFVFSPCAKYLACVSQDGFLRVYCYDTMELVGRARSYYGGLSCVCWSPDGKYVVTGGEDDLITVWSFVERRVVARGMGHKSWVSVVAFDSYCTGNDLTNDTDVDNDDDEDEVDNKIVDEHDLEGEGYEDEDDEIEDLKNRRFSKSMQYGPSTRYPSGQNSYTSYRFGSVGQDTQLCLWDLNDDLLKQPIAKSKATSFSGTTSVANAADLSSNKDKKHIEQQQIEGTSIFSVENSHTTSVNKSEENSAPTPTLAIPTTISSTTKDITTSGGSFLSSKGGSFTKTFSLVVKRDKRNQKNYDKINHTTSINPVNSNVEKLVDDPTKLLGSNICPRMNEVPILEPSVCKKISFERLTSLIFCRGGFITSCQDGYVFSWARPSRKTLRVSPGHSNEELRVIDLGTSSVV